MPAKRQQRNQAKPKEDLCALVLRNVDALVPREGRTVVMYGCTIIIFSPDRRLQWNVFPDEMPYGEIQIYSYPLSRKPACVIRYNEGEDVHFRRSPESRSRTSNAGGTLSVGLDQYMVRKVFDEPIERKIVRAKDYVTLWQKIQQSERAVE
ncbi:hypothetical protein HYS47_01270 [Candidatus Woesearchaeota archaeon]|nr:hypothetical protein [Candidatus Woesearchaeota archaeon]